MDNQINRKYSVSSGLFYLTFNKVDVAVVCQTRNFQTELVVCMLCFPNIVHVIFIRTVSFKFHLNHGHLRVWFLKEQKAHFIENIRHYLWLKSWFLCQVDKLRDFIQISFLQTLKANDWSRKCYILCQLSFGKHSLSCSIFRQESFISAGDWGGVGGGGSHGFDPPPKWSL